VAAPPPRPLPLLTVQLPLYNECYVAPPDRGRGTARLAGGPLEIQILDDSEDDTAAIVDRAAGDLRPGGSRGGAPARGPGRVQAGALAAGLAVARGELIAILDADFLPPSDFARRLSPLRRPRVGMVQRAGGT